MMGNDNQQLKEWAEENVDANELVARCIELIDARGGIFCQAEGVRRVGRMLVSYADEQITRSRIKVKAPGDE